LTNARRVSYDRSDEVAGSFRAVPIAATADPGGQPTVLDVEALGISGVPSNTRAESGDEPAFHRTPSVALHDTMRARGAFVVSAPGAERTEP
jgi:hypothetical protein